MGSVEGRGGRQLRFLRRISGGRSKGEDGATRGADAGSGQEQRSGKTDESEKSGGFRRGAQGGGSERNEGGGIET